MVSGTWRWGALAGLYLVLAGEASAAEVTAAVLAGAAAMALSLLLRARAERRFHIRVPWHRLVARIGWALLHDVARLAPRLLADVAGGRGGQFLRQHVTMPPGDAEAAGRRALAILLASLAPNAYVVVAHRRAFLLHRLAAAPPSADREWPL